MNLKLNTWDLFESKIQALWQLTFYKEFFKKYLRRSLQMYVDDGINRVEVRGFLNSIFDKDGKLLPLAKEI